MPAGRDQKLRPVRVATVRHEDVAPAGAVAGDVPRIEGQVREVLEEDPRLDLGGDPGGHDFSQQRLVVLVAGRHRPDHHVAGRQAGRQRAGGHRPQQARQADPAGLQGDGLAVGGQAAEPDEQPDKQRDRNRDPQRLWQQRRHDPQDGDGADAFLDEALRHLHQRVDQQV